MGYYYYVCFILCACIHACHNNIIDPIILVYIVFCIVCVYKYYTCNESIVEKFIEGIKQYFFAFCCFIIIKLLALSVCSIVIQKCVLLMIKLSIISK